MKIVNINLGEKYDVYGGRSGKNQIGIFGNPHPIGYCKICNKQHTREEAIKAFRPYFYDKIKIDAEFKKQVESLKNKTVGCFCKRKDKEISCHLDIIKEYLDNMNENSFKLAVVGSRTFQDKERLYKILDKNIEKIELIISGGASGADSLAHEWAKERGKPILIYYPQWRDLNGNYDKGAGFKRNWNIIKAADKILIFWDGSSKGTQHDIDICEKTQKPYKILKFVPTITKENDEPVTH